MRFLARHRTIAIGSQPPKRPKHPEIGHDPVTAKNASVVNAPSPMHEASSPAALTFSMPADRRRSLSRLVRCQPARSQASPTRTTRSAGARRRRASRPAGRHQRCSSSAATSYPERANLSAAGMELALGRSCPSEIVNTMDDSMIPFSTRRPGPGSR